jgi:N-acetylglucosamine transport system substrate-binding protein
MNVRKWSMFCMALLLILVASGCGGKTGTTQGTEKPPETNAAGTSPDATKTGAAKLTGNFEIQYFVGGFGDKWWKQVLGEFQAANPDLKIKESAGPKINEQNKPRWIGGNPPDFVYIDGPELFDRQMVDDGQLEDLTDWIKDAKNVDGDKMLDLLSQQPLDFNGKIYTVPLVLNSWGIFYDKALFKDKGWEIPTNFPDFLTVSEKIKAAGTIPFIHTGKYPYYINRAFLYPAIVSANKDDFKLLKDMSENKLEAWKNPAIIAGLNKIVEIRDKGFIDKASIQINHTDSQSLFLQHKDAFIPNGLWLPNEMAKDVPAAFDFGFIPSITQDKGGKVVANTSTSTVAIAKKGKNKEAAKAFLQFIIAKKQAIQWAELSGAPSNIKGDLSSSKAASFVKDAAKYLTSDNTVVVPTYSFSADVDTAMQDATDALTISTITPEEWVKRVTDVVAKQKK